jgi:RNA polymerase sigma-70 factor (ECF subfamily)
MVAVAWRPSAGLGLSGKLQISEVRVAPQRSGIEQPLALDADCTLLSDEDLLAQFRDTSSPSLYTELVRRYLRPLYRYIVRLLDDPILAEDVLQNTFLQVFSRCELYRDGWPVRPWLYAIARNQAFDVLRRGRRHAAASLDQSIETADSAQQCGLDEVVPDAKPGPLEALEEAERCVWLWDRVNRLAEPFREVIILFYFRGLSYRQIADKLHIPLGTLKTRIHAALVRLRRMAYAQCHA